MTDQVNTEPTAIAAVPEAPKKRRFVPTKDNAVKALKYTLMGVGGLTIASKAIALANKDVSVDLHAEVTDSEDTEND